MGTVFLLSPIRIFFELPISIILFSQRFMSFDHYSGEIISYFVESLQRYYCTLLRVIDLSLSIGWARINATDKKVNVLWMHVHANVSER